jgi:hypothetical protein
MVKMFNSSANVPGFIRAPQNGASCDFCRISQGLRGLTSFPFLSQCPKEEKMIKKAKSGYKVVSEKGKNLGGPYKSKAAAQKRLRQVEFFKHRKG